MACGVALALAIWGCVRSRRPPPKGGAYDDAGVVDAADDDANVDVDEAGAEADEALGPSFNRFSRSAISSCFCFIW